MELLVNIDVPDLAAAEQLYIAAFGLRPGRRFGAAAVELLGAAVPIYLLAQPGGSPAAAEACRDYARHWTPVHLDVVVDDLKAALARALAAGLRPDEPGPATGAATIRLAPWGRLARLADPFGHGWCLIQFSAAGYDAIAGPAPPPAAGD